MPFIGREKETESAVSNAGAFAGGCSAVLYLWDFSLGVNFNNLMKYVVYIWIPFLN